MPKNKNIKSYRHKFVVNLLCQDWIRFLASLINENKIWFIWSSVLILLLTGVTLVQTWVIQNLVDKTIEFNFDGIIQMLIVLLGIVAFNIVFNYLKIRATTQFGANSGAFLKNQISYKILYCRYQDISSASTGDVLKTIIGDVEKCL
jgi:ABC-type multidrug transport system fused ATPase/permease subunit